MFPWKIPWCIIGVLLLDALLVPVYPHPEQWLPNAALRGMVDTFMYAVQSGSCFISGVEVLSAPAWCRSYTQQVRLPSPTTFAFLKPA